MSHEGRARLAPALHRGKRNARFHRHQNRTLSARRTAFVGRERGAGPMEPHGWPTAGRRAVQSTLLHSTGWKVKVPIKIERGSRDRGPHAAQCGEQRAERGGCDVSVQQGRVGRCAFLIGGGVGRKYCMRTLSGGGIGWKGRRARRVAYPWPAAAQPGRRKEGPRGHALPVGVSQREPGPRLLEFASLRRVRAGVAREGTALQDCHKTMALQSALQCSYDALSEYCGSERDSAAWAGREALLSRRHKQRPVTSGERTAGRGGAGGL